MKSKKNSNTKRSGVAVDALVRIFHRGAEVFVWLHKFVIKNVFFIERPGGPVTYALCLVLLPLLPVWAAACACGEMLIALDEEFQ
jgi:hypothetical protein